MWAGASQDASEGFLGSWFRSWEAGRLGGRGGGAVLGVAIYTWRRRDVNYREEEARQARKTP